MISNPRVSVLTLTYNHQHFIAECLDSALMQRTSFPVEIVIGEDCSTDRTKEIAQRIAERNPERIRLVLRSQNLGGPENFQQTLAVCRAPYVAILEGDDYWSDPWKLQRQVDALDSNPDWTMCFHPVRCVHEDKSQPDFTFPHGFQRSAFAIDDILRRNFIQSCSVMYRQGVLGELPAWHSQSVLGDWPLHILYADRGKIGFLPEEMAVYRIHRQSSWSSRDEISRYRAVLEMLTAVDQHFEGRYRRQIDEARLELISDLLTLRTSLDYRLGQQLLAPVRKVLNAVHRVRKGNSR